ncbi:hypothetical protein Btru_070109 [Bulinus truncatus]|nr:hypothetical protein Btru_070109 [Bulinus truncatus]
MGDVFLSLPVRYIGYGYAYNEGAKYAVNYERLFLTVANFYILAHVILKAFDASDAASGAVLCLDTLIFHVIATVGLPLLIATVVRSITEEIMHNFRTGPQLSRWGPVIVVVAVIIIASRPLDNLVNQLMDATIRKALK